MPHLTRTPPSTQAAPPRTALRLTRTPPTIVPSVLFQVISSSSPSAKASTCGLGLVRRVQADLVPTWSRDATV